jgi:MFS family permease
MFIYFTYALVLFSFTSRHASLVLLTLYALKFGARPFAVGILAATFSVLPMLLSWQVGKLADRFGSRWTLLFGAAGGACGMLVPYYFPGLPALYIAGVMNGFLIAFSSVSVHNLVGLLSEPHNRALNFSNLTLMTSAGAFLGPLFAGFAIDQSGHAATCLYIVLLSLVPVTMLTLWGGALPGGSRETHPSRSVREMLTGSGLWRILATSSLMMSGIALFHFYMPVYGSSIGLSASAIGVVIATYSAAAFIVRLILPRLIARLGEEKVLAYALFLAAAGFMLTPFFNSYRMLALASFIFGFGMGCIDPVTIMLTFSNSVEGRSGEALGMRITINQLTGTIIPVVFGVIGSAFGAFPVFWLNALMLASGGAFNMPRRIGRKRMLR